MLEIVRQCMFVSTHSRPKAAGSKTSSLVPLNGGFNTQPPEGGWRHCRPDFCKSSVVSTHSRPKAAGGIVALIFVNRRWFQHTAARRRLAVSVSTSLLSFSCFNTQPPEGGWVYADAELAYKELFQHTAARRRLVDAKLDI